MDIINTDNQPIAIKNTINILDEYFEDIKADLTSIESRKTYKRTLKQFFNFLLKKEITLNETNKQTVVEYRDTLKNEMSPHSVNNYLDSVKRFFEWLEARRYFPNIAKPVKRLRIEKGFTKEILDTFQLKAVYACLFEQIEKSEGNQKQYLTALRNLAMFDLILKTGLRTMSVCSIQIKHLSKKRGRFVVEYKQKGKEGKSFAILEPLTVKRINKYISARNDSNSPDSFLFTSHSNNKKDGSILSTKTVRYEIRKLYDKAGLLEQLNEEGKIKNKITAHSLRHTYGVAIAKTKGVHAAQIELGHASSDTTKLYLKKIEDEQRFVDRADLDNFFGV